MYLLLNGVRYRLNRVELILEINALATLCIAFESGAQDAELFSEERQRAVSGGSTNATLKDDQGDLQIRILGFQTLVGGKLTLHGVVATPLIEQWLRAVPNHGARTEWLVFQRKKRDDESAGMFVRRLLGNHLGLSSALSSDGPHSLDGLFPPRACVVRGARNSNAQFLGQLMGWVRSRRPAIRGWIASNVPNEPLRFVLHQDDTAISLNDWKTDITAAHRLHPERFAATSWSRERCRLRHSFPTTAPVRLLAALSGPAVGEEQVLRAPCSVRVDGRTFFAPRVSYLWEKGELNQEGISKLTAIVDIEDVEQPLPLDRFPPQTLLAGFQAWVGEDAPTFAKLAPAAVSNWKIDGGESIEAALLRPGASRADFAGIHVTHRKDDVLDLMLVTGSEPLALGGRQGYFPAFDNTALTLHGDSVLLSRSAKNVEPGNATGVRVAEDEVALRQEKPLNHVRLDSKEKSISLVAEEKSIVSAGKHVQVSINNRANIVVTQDQVDVLQHELVIEQGKATFAGDAEIGKNLTVKANLEVS